MSEKTRPAEGYAAVAIFISVVIAYFFRSFFGVSVGDEALFVAAADFPRMGGRWFVDEISLQTTGSILISPFVTAYTSIVGTEALFLFSRLLYLSFAVCTALVTFEFLKRLCRWTTALLLSASIVAFVPHGMACITYNQIGYLFFGLAILMSLIGLFDSRLRWAFGGGVFWVCCVFGYPTQLVNFFLFSLLIAVFLWKNPKRRRPFLLPWFAGLVIPSVILVSVLFYCGIENIKTAIQVSTYMSNVFGMNKFIYSFGLLATYLPPLWFLIPTLAAWTFILLKAPRYAAAGLAVLYLEYIFLGGQSEGSFGTMFWPLAQLPVLAVASVYWRKWSPEVRWIAVCLLAPCLVGAFVGMATSRLTVYNMFGPAAFGTLTLAALLAGKSRNAGWGLSLLILIFIVQYTFPRFYEDAEFEKLNYEISEGPFRFLKTNSLKGRAIEAAQADIKAMPSQGTVLFLEHFPVGYLMTDLKPRGPMINMVPGFLQPEMRPVFKFLFERNESYWTDYVFEFRQFPMSEGNVYYYREPEGEEPVAQEFQMDPFYNFFMRSGRYKVILDRGLYRILQKIR